MQFFSLSLFYLFDFCYRSGRELPRLSFIPSCSRILFDNFFLPLSLPFFLWFPVFFLCFPKIETRSSASTCLRLSIAVSFVCIVSNGKNALARVMSAANCVPAAIPLSIYRRAIGVAELTAVKHIRDGRPSFLRVSISADWVNILVMTRSKRP